MPQIGDIELRINATLVEDEVRHRRQFIYQACGDCGKERWVSFAEWQKGSSRYCQLCSLKHCDFNAKSIRWGKDNPKWKGGRKKTKDGYIGIRVYPDDPYYAMASQRYILEHRLIMAISLKRVLRRDELVHHKDGNPSNNKLSNLELCLANNHKLSYREGYKRGFQDGIVYASTPDSPLWEECADKPEQGVKILV